MLNSCVDSGINGCSVLRCDCPYPVVLKWNSVLLHVNLFYRYGREDLEVFGLNFRRDLVDVSVDVLLHWIM